MEIIFNDIQNNRNQVKRLKIMQENNLLYSQMFDLNNYLTAIRMRLKQVSSRFISWVNCNYSNILKNNILK